MQKRPQGFDPRQDMNCNSFEIFHYLDIKTRHMEVHFHNFYEVFLFLDGDVDYWVEGSVYHLKSGDILLINPTELHKPLPKEETNTYERIVLWIDKAYLASIENGMLEKCFQEDKKLYRLTSAERNEILPLFDRLVSEYHKEDFAAKPCAYGILLQLLTQLNRLSISRNSASSEKYITSTFISEVLSYIGEHYSENLSLDDLAAHFFVSKYYLSHEFKKSVGTGIHRYIILKRLNIAYSMLNNGISPTEVSHLCGFKDYTNFFRNFKAEYGVSPKECIQ